VSVEERWSTAIHEAGHVVVAWTFGLPVGAMEIGIDGDDTSGKSEIAETASLTVVDRIALCAAGVQAERVFGRKILRDQSAFSDYAKIDAILDVLPIEQADGLQLRGHDRAFEILKLHRPMVERLAEHLTRNGRLGQKEVRSLLSLPIAAKPAPPPVGGQF
jgi:hypothetical protein